MDKHQAEKIINLYGAAIANNKNPLKKRSALPCSTAKIRYAFYVYIHQLIKQFGHLPKDIGENLVSTYSMLDAFIEDAAADRLNNVAELIKHKQLSAENSEDKKKIDEYFSLVLNAIRNSNYFDEINDYIGECYRELGIKT